MDPYKEGELLARTLSTLRGYWDGRASIAEMRDGGSRNWRQTEWFGFYFEWKGLALLTATHGGGPGPSVGRSSMDYELIYPWDLKAHPLKRSSRSWGPLNDAEAINTAIRDSGACGFLVGVGEAFMDDDGSFAKWQREYGGGESQYTRNRRERGAPPRRRKIAFELQEVVAFVLRSPEDVLRGHEEGWLSGFQEGMRNSDGSPRRLKYKVDIKSIPNWARGHPNA